MRNWKISDEDFIKAVKDNISIAGTIKALGLNIGGGAYRMVRMRVRLLNLDISHWQGQAVFKGVRFPRKRALDDILVENSEYEGAKLKQWLLDANLLVNECSICSLPPFWNSQPLTLQLDHINGIPNDNRLENLRLLCPNCHTQTPTWGAKRLKKPDNYCTCGTKIQRRSKTCGPCRMKF